MYPDSLYAQGRGSFLRPVPIPAHGPLTPPTKTVVVSCEWLPYIRGALQQLLLQSTWNTNNPAFLTDIQGNVANLIDLFSECSTSDLPFTCDYDYLVSQGSWGNVSHPDYSPSEFGEYVAGGGWFATENQSIALGSWLTSIDIIKTFSPPVAVNHLKAQYDLAKGSFAFPGYNTGFYGYSSGVLVLQHTVASIFDPDGSGKILDFDFPEVTIDLLEILMIAGDAMSSPAPGGSLNLTKVEVDGRGYVLC
jgi:hypothetical protein